MLCRPADAVIRPAAPSEPVQAPRSRPSAAEVLVQPRVAVGGGDPLRLAPVEQRADQRMRVPHLPQPPGPGVRHVDADPGQQRLHLGRAAQVDGDARGHVPQHLRVAGGPQRHRVGVAARPGADEGGQDLLRDGPVHRQPVRGQLGAEQFGGGLGAGRRQGHRPAVQRGQRRLLLPGDIQGQGRPPCHPPWTVRPAAADPLRAQVPVRRHRVAGVAPSTPNRSSGPPAGIVSVARPRSRAQASRGRPASRRTAAGAPRRYPSTWPAASRRRPAAPPSGPTRAPTGAAVPRPPARPRPRGRNRPRTVPGGQPELEGGRDDQRDEIAAVHACLPQRRHKVRTRHGPNLATLAAPQAPRPRRRQRAARRRQRAGASPPTVGVGRRQGCPLAGGRRSRSLCRRGRLQESFAICGPERADGPGRSRSAVMRAACGARVPPEVGVQ